MDRKSFLGRFLAFMAALKLIKKEDSWKPDFDCAEHKDLKNMKPLTFRDLISKTDGSELHFVTYRETKTSGLIT